MSELQKPLSAIPRDAQAPVEKLPATYRLNAEVWQKSLATMATHAWKLKGRVIDSETKEARAFSREEAKKLVRHVEGILEALSSLNVEVRDRTGEAYDYGLPDKIVSSSPRAGLTKELIVETIRPTVYWLDQIAQVGEVVIATPLETKEEKPEEKK